jgi:hypothetical protein
MHKVIQMLPLGDSKKSKAIRHAASGGGGAFAVVMILNQWPGLVPYVVADDRYKDSVETVTVVKTEMKSITKEVSEFKSDYKSDMQWLKTSIMAQNVKQGVVVPEPPKEEKPATVVIHYDDSTGRGVVVRGDTVWVPIPDTLPATRPR